MDTNNTQSLWQEIKQKIEIKIISSELKSGDKAPSVDKITKEYGVARITAAIALKKLCEEGIIMKKSSMGYYVKPYVATKLKVNHINNLKNDAEKMIAHAKGINANYEEFKPIYDLLNDYMNSLGSSDLAQKQE